jgi:hypothetical protein
MTVNDIPPWAEGWAEHLREAARQLGFVDFLAFMNAHVGEPYGKVLRVLRMHLGYMVPLMQLQKLHMHEAIVVGKGREAAKDSLVRTLRQELPNGWNTGKQCQERRAWARAYWVLPSSDATEAEKMKAVADSVWDELQAMNPPDNWCPATPNDPIIEAAFARGWSGISMKASTSDF